MRQFTHISPDSAILIGRKGRSLEAMQYLINCMMPHDDEGEVQERITVDIEGYQGIFQRLPS